MNYDGIFLFVDNFQLLMRVIKNEFNVIELKDSRGVEYGFKSEFVNILDMRRNILHLYPYFRCSGDLGPNVNIIVSCFI